jgi:hypothetical protein
VIAEPVSGVAFALLMKEPEPGRRTVKEAGLLERPAMVSLRKKYVGPLVDAVESVGVKVKVYGGAAVTPIPLATPVVGGGVVAFVGSVVAPLDHVIASPAAAFEM